MTRATVAASVAMFSVPFLLLGVCYAALPVEVPALQNLFTGKVILAPKSLFMVFRVPLMNLTHGLMAAVMLSRSRDFEDARRRTSYSAAFLILLFVIALKANLEALEIGALVWSFKLLMPWFVRGGVVLIIGGLGLALVRARGVPAPWPELRLSNVDKVTIAGLFSAYLAMVAATFLALGRF